MKKIILLFILLPGLALMSFKRVNVHTDVFKVDTKLSKLEWFGSKKSGNHNGTVEFSGGEIHDNHGNLTGSVEVDMNTIKNTDISDETYRGKLEGHLKSADFFDVEKYPKSIFVISSTTPLNNPTTPGATHLVKGNLTIKDKTNEISFEATIKDELGKKICTGSAVIDRSKYDIRYGSKTFFSDIGEKVIYDEFTLKFNIVANYKSH